MVVRDDPSSPWRVLEGSRDSETDGEKLELIDADGPSTSGAKRPRTISGTDVPEAKRTRLSPESSSLCIAPAPNLVARKIYEQPSLGDAVSSLGTGYLFLTEGWRARWCRCKSVR